MKRRDALKLGGAVVAGTTLAGVSSVSARGPVLLAQNNQNATLRLVKGGGFPNGLDLHKVGANRPAYELSWNLYDRLLTFGKKTLPDGSLSYDYTVIEPELAEDYTLAGDGMSATFKLRRDVTFHDGTPVTAKDVKWSYDRAVLIGGFPTFQMKAGALENPEQFVVVDDHTFRVDFIRQDKLTLLDIAVPIPKIIHSEMVKQHVTEADPWGAEWLSNNVAGSGAYRLASYKPNERVELVRNDEWKCGPMPQMQQVILLNVPEAGNRRALLERGDVDINFDLLEKDAKELKDLNKFTVQTTPVENALISIDMNTQPQLAGAPNPFADKNVRLAVAHAVPYDNIWNTSFFGQVVKMYGSGSPEVSSTLWPQPSPYSTDLEKARAALAASGYADGFETTLAFDLGQKEWAEPMCVLIQEALGQIGIRVTLDKVPSSNFRAVLVEKSRPMIINNFGGWLNFPDYFFFYAYHGQDATFNGSSYQNPAMDALIDAALASGPGDPAYEQNVLGFIQMAFEEMPRVPVVQPVLSVAMQPQIQGYQYWFHRQLDYRQIRKA
ncbi:MAG: ABC transporter substrate-binding protein [Synechococcaceae cyanobacterium SM2_3_1]|nr:ABC transporter substrate-binding protein [Synechococcaceae cyanobacterium SM2_3_1]